MALRASSSSPWRRWSPPLESSRTSSRRRKSWWRTCKLLSQLAQNPLRFFQDCCFFPNFDLQGPQLLLLWPKLLNIHAKRPYHHQHKDHLSIIISIYYLVDRPSTPL